MTRSPLLPSKRGENGRRKETNATTALEGWTRRFTELAPIRKAERRAIFRRRGSEVPRSLSIREIKRGADDQKGEPTAGGERCRKSLTRFNLEGEGGTEHQNQGKQAIKERGFPKSTINSKTKERSFQGESKRRSG